MRARWLMNGSDLDRLARSMASAGGTRRSILAGTFVVVAASGFASGTEAKRKKKKITICNGGQTLTVRKKGWQSHYPNATVGECQSPPPPPPPLPSDVCADCPDTCYATDIHPDQDPNSIQYACCPAQLVCLTTSALPNQCCYPDEFCKPSLIHNFP